MTRAQAVTRLTKIYGKRLLYRVSDGAPNAEQRNKAQAAAQELREARVELQKAIATRRAELLNVPDYQQMLEQLDAIEVSRQKLTSIQGSYKFSVGHNFLGFFNVDAQGDTWEEVFAAIGKKGGA